MRTRNALLALPFALCILQPALASPDHLAVPAAYDNVGAGTVWGQTFTAESGSVLGASWYFGDPSRPDVAAVSALEGPADLVLFDATDLTSPIEIARTQAQGTGSRSFGLTGFMFSTGAPTAVGGSYFIGLDTLDPYGIGLRGLTASTYSGGSQAYFDGGIIHVASLGRDTSFAIISAPVPEPSAYALLGIGLLVVAVAGRRATHGVD